MSEPSGQSPAPPTPPGGGGSSSSSTSVPTPKAKPAKQPKPTTANGTDATATVKAGKGKEKSAKDLKKEKRAAAVAQRGGGEDPRAVAASAASGASSTPTGSVIAGEGSSISNQSPNASTFQQVPHAPTTTGANAPPRRPAPFVSDGSYILPSAPSQSLFFSHLPILTPPDTSPAVRSGKIHPLVIRLGCLMSSGAIRGSNARTTGMMMAFREVIRDYTSPENAVLWKDLPGHLSPMIAWLEGCRPKGAGGGNAIRWLKGEINKLGEESEERSEADVSLSLID